MSDSLPLVRPSAAAVPWRAYACLASSMALVGSYVGLSRLLVAVLPIFLLAWLRFAIGAVAMLGWLKAGPDDQPLTPQDKRLLFWDSFLGNFLFSICMLTGVAMSSAVSAGVTMAAIPAAVAVLSWLFLRERISTRVALAIACAVSGIVLLALARTPGAASSPAASMPTSLAAGAGPGGAAWHGLVGQALLLGAVLCEASYVVIGKRLSGRVSPRRISALINLWGLALVTPLGLWQALSFDFSAVPTAMWLLLVAYSLAASVATVWLWMKGLQHVPAQRAGVFTVMLPISAALVGVLFLGEAFSSAHLAAFGLALAGLLLATWPGGKPR